MRHRGDLIEDLDGCVDASLCRLVVGAFEVDRTRTVGAVSESEMGGRTGRRTVWRRRPMRRRTVALEAIGGTAELILRTGARSSLWGRRRLPQGGGREHCHGRSQ